VTNYTPQQQAANAIDIAVEAIRRLPREDWGGYVAWFFEGLENVDGPKIIEESADVLRARIDAGRW
jgi:hypothetical protein